MNLTMKSILMLAALFVYQAAASTESNPHQFIDNRAQAMVAVITSNQSLYASNPDQFKEKINAIFEPMVDFRTVGRLVMGKKLYSSATKEQRAKFIAVFRTSLLENYSSTLAQWGDQTIETIFPDKTIFNKIEGVRQNLITSNNRYPITYKVRNDGEGNWLIINIIVNGVNLGMTFRNHFQALASEHNENIDDIISHWTSDANF